MSMVHQKMPLCPLRFCCTKGKTGTTPARVAQNVFYSAREKFAHPSAPFFCRPNNRKGFSQFHNDAYLANSCLYAFSAKETKFLESFQLMLIIGIFTACLTAKMLIFIYYLNSLRNVGKKFTKITNN